MRETITLTQPKKQTPITTADPSRLPEPRTGRIPSPYVFAHWDGWEFDREFSHGFLPNLTKIVAEPGCNGVTHSGDMSGTIATIVQRGATVIQPNDRRLIQDGETDENAEFYHYPRYYETQNNPPRKWWVEPGQEPTVTARGEILWDQRKIRETSARFRAHLRDAGIVRPLHALTFEAEILKQEARVRRIAQRVGNNPHLAETLKTEEAIIDQMRAAWESMKATDMSNGQPLAAKAARPKAVTPKAKRGQP